MLTTRTLRASKSTFPPCLAASSASSYWIPVALPSSVIRGSLPTAGELDPMNFALWVFSKEGRRRVSPKKESFSKEGEVLQRQSVFLLRPLVCWLSFTVLG